jgi:hypothetical protein
MASALVVIVVAALFVPVVPYEESFEKEVVVSYEVTKTSTVKLLSSPRVNFTSTLASSEGIIHDAKFKIDWGMKPAFFFLVQPEIWFTRVGVTLPEGLADEYIWTSSEVEGFLKKIRDRLAQIVIGAPFLGGIDPWSITVIYERLVAGFLKDYGIIVGVDGTTDIFTAMETARVVRDRPQTSRCSYNFKRVWTFLFKMEGAVETVDCWGVGFGATAFAWVLLPLSVGPTLPLGIFDIKASQVETLRMDFVKSIENRTETRIERRMIYISMVQYLLKILRKSG